MMMMMKNPIVLVACMLLLSSLTVMASQSVFGPDECCFNFISHPLPKKRVVTYKFTDKLCPMEGVLFTMLNRAKLCANPSVEWVQNIIKIKDEAQTRNASLHS